MSKLLLNMLDRGVYHDKKTEEGEVMSLAGGFNYSNQSSQLRTELEQRLVDVRTNHTDIWGRAFQAMGRLCRASFMFKEQKNC